MDDPAIDPLERLQRQAHALALQRLRSASASVARLREAIGQAHAMGHSHAVIHARLCACGLVVSWNNYRAALVRARRCARRAAAEASTTARTDMPPQDIGPAATADANAPAGSPVQLLDTLAAAQRAAARDYAQIARGRGRGNPPPS